MHFFAPSHTFNHAYQQLNRQGYFNHEHAHKKFTNMSELSANIWDIESNNCIRQQARNDQRYRITPTTPNPIAAISTPHPINNIFKELFCILNHAKYDAIKTDIANSQNKSSKQMLQKLTEQRCIQAVKFLIGLQTVFGSIYSHMDKDIRLLKSSVINHGWFIHSLAKVIIKIGLLKDVVSLEEQNFLVKSKEKMLQNLGIRTLSWNEVDVDGDDEHPTSKALRIGNIQGKTFTEIFLLHRQLRHQSDDRISQKHPRISYLDKRGVKGLKKQLDIIAPNIQSMTDLFNTKNMENTYKNLVKLLKQLQYNPNPSDILDFIIRVVLPIFIENGQPIAEGFVISDFNSKDTAVLPKLQALFFLVKRYLVENNLMSKDQVENICHRYAPLCERYETINAFPNLFKNLLDEIDDLLNKKLITYQQAAYILANKGHYFIEFFGGPSDATVSSGISSIRQITFSMDLCRWYMANFLEKHFQLKTYFQFIIQYGVGTGRRRINNTMQGVTKTEQGVSDTVSPNMAHRNNAARAEHQTLHSASFKKPMDKKLFIAEAKRTHDRFWGEHGINTIATNALLKNKDSLIGTIGVTKRYYNNTGSRGRARKDTVKLYSGRRAIDSAALVASTGLIEAPGYPKSGIPTSWDLIKTLNNDNVELSCLINQLSQCVVLAPKRAGMLGYSKEVIMKNIGYAQSFMQSITRNLGLKKLDITDTTITVDMLLSIIIERVNDPEVKKTLLIFQAQAYELDRLKNIATNHLALLNNEWKKTGKLIEKSLANFAFSANALSNYQLPIITAHKVVEKYRNTQVNDQYFYSWLANSRKSHGHSQMLAKL